LIYEAEWERVGGREREGRVGERGAERERVKGRS
jgi:hypothetical protein